MDEGNEIEQLLQCWHDHMFRLQSITIIDAWSLPIWQLLAKTRSISWLLAQAAIVSQPLQRLRIYHLLWPKLNSSDQEHVVGQIAQTIMGINSLPLRLEAISMVAALVPEQSNIWLDQVLTLVEMLDNSETQAQCLIQMLLANPDKLRLEQIHQRALQLEPSHITHQLLSKLIRHELANEQFESARQIACSLVQDYQSSEGWNLFSKRFLGTGGSVAQLLAIWTSQDQPKLLPLLIAGLLEAQRLTEALQWFAQYPQLAEQVDLKSSLVMAYVEAGYLADATPIALTIPQRWTELHPINHIIKAWLKLHNFEQALNLARQISNPWQEIRGLIMVLRYAPNLEPTNFSALFAEAHAHVAKLNDPKLKAWAIFDLIEANCLLAEAQASSLYAEILEIAALIDDDDDYDRLIEAVCHRFISAKRIDQAEELLQILRDPSVASSLNVALIQAYLAADRLTDAMRLAFTNNERALWECLIRYYCGQNQLDLALELSRKLQNSYQEQLIETLTTGLAKAQQIERALLVAHYANSPLERSKHLLQIAAAVRNHTNFYHQGLLLTIEQMIAKISDQEQRLLQRIQLSLELGLLDLAKGLASLTFAMTEAPFFAEVYDCEIWDVKIQILLRHGDLPAAKQLLVEVSGFRQHWLQLVLINRLAEYGLVTEALSLIEHIDGSALEQARCYAKIAEWVDDPDQAQALINQALGLIVTAPVDISLMQSLATIAIKHQLFEQAGQLCTQIRDPDQRKYMQVQMYIQQAMPDHALELGLSIEQPSIRMQALVLLADIYPANAYYDLITNLWVQTTTTLELAQMAGFVVPLLRDAPLIALELLRITTCLESTTPTELLNI